MVNFEIFRVLTCGRVYKDAATKIKSLKAKERVCLRKF